MTPINNLPEPHFPPSSAQPGVSGESVNAPYGPKAVDECGIDSVATEYNAQGDNRKTSEFAVGKTSGPAQKPVGGLHEDFSESSVHP